MWPDGISITASRLTLTSIDDINLLNLAIAVPVVLTEVYLLLDSIASINNHLRCIRIILTTCVLTIIFIRMLELYGSDDIESEVELTVALVEEIIMYTSNSTVIIRISLLVKHILIERLDIILTWSECQYVLRVLESHILKLNQDNKSFLFTFPSRTEALPERL